MKFFDFLVEKLTGPAPSEPVKPMDTSGIVLVAGATGGVGRRVVDVLRKKGLPVRVLVSTPTCYLTATQRVKVFCCYALFCCTVYLIFKLSFLWRYVLINTE